MTRVVATSLSEHVLAARQRLQSVRDQARNRYQNGEPGLQTAALLSSAIDSTLIGLWESALAALPEREQQRLKSMMAIVAVGGSGRGELCPFSDSDILFLHSPRITAEAQRSVATVVRDAWDAGIKLSHSIRTAEDAVTMALREPQFATALVEARLLWGDERLFGSLQRRFARRCVRLRRSAFYNNCVKSRDRERAQYGESARQLEPDVKRGSGGHRDIHLIRWLGFAVFGTSDLDLLRRSGALTTEDFDALNRAQEFLTRIRSDLHFFAGKAQEVLTRTEQLRLSELYGFHDSPVQRGVEQFMQVYFRHANAVADAAARFSACHQPRPFMQRLWSFIATHNSNEWFVVRGSEITVKSNRRAALLADVDRLLNLFELAGLYSVDVEPSLVRDISVAVPRLPEELPVAAAQRFMNILGVTGRVGRVLRAMHSTGLLDRVLPEMAHARCLMQFNQYHAYTVDEHSLRAIEAAESLIHDTTAIGAAYREVHDRGLFHLAVLLHDLGKGYVEDHSEVGRRIALTVADRLRLTVPQRDQLAFLVHQHLAMPHIAFRRDLSDAELLVRFARSVGSPEYLRKLFLLTVADIRAVSTTAWTEWKAELLLQLYEQAMLRLSGEPQRFDAEARFESMCRDVAAAWAATKTAGEESELDSVRNRLRVFPAHYLSSTRPQSIVDDLRSLASIDSSGESVVTAAFDPATGTIEIQIVTPDRAGTGLFARLTGALLVHNLEILTAAICTTSTEIAVDRFRVIDRDFAGEPPASRLTEIRDTIRSVLSGASDVVQMLRRRGRYYAVQSLPEWTGEPSRVVIDQESSAAFAIIDVFTRDRRGLLYDLACTLRDQGLSVAIAKISTHVDQVLDVFYVTRRRGGKPNGDAELSQIHSALMKCLDETASSASRA